jgi:hypothetical protein
MEELILCISKKNIEGMALALNLKMRPLNGLKVRV